ncbi:hypothetical protein [Leucobacter ruminantium]|uniref:Uncharacterized protein n=1 Tax=Leucobacter ruminantium TaxID=1289170 RepID=A0A939RTL7_9MICO|nr:hypothetical protein [Leucobacter ruminantium]MBO1804515.1 hypothetical protein [Leucobacter ruminantium]
MSALAATATAPRPRKPSVGQVVFLTASAAFFAIAVALVPVYCVACGDMAFVATP